MTHNALHSRNAPSADSPPPPPSPPFVVRTCCRSHGLRQGTLADPARGWQGRPVGGSEAGSAKTSAKRRRGSRIIQRKLGVLRSLLREAMRTPPGFTEAFMRPTRIVLALLAAWLPLAAGAEAPLTLPDSTAAERSSVSLTVYNVDLALVRETRTLTVPRSGTAALRFMDVPSAINPRTVHLKSLAAPDDLTGLKQNYEYDLISPAKLMEKYVGREVEIVEQADDLTTRQETATLLSVNGGPVYQVGDRIVLNQTGKVRSLRSHRTSSPGPPSSGPSMRANRVARRSRLPTSPTT